ncbi:MAG: SpaA isopeptide-forming pilin-related protein [Clostridium sp.]
MKKKVSVFLVIIFICTSCFSEVAFSINIKNNISGNDITKYSGIVDNTIFTNVTITKDNKLIQNTTLHTNDGLIVNYKFNIPEQLRKQIKPGDYFRFKLPKYIVPADGAINGELQNNAGVNFANFKIDTNGDVVFIFTKNIETNSNISGDFFVSAKLDEEAIGKPGEIVIKTPFTQQVTNIKVMVSPENSKDLTKDYKDGAFNVGKPFTDWIVTANGTAHTLVNGKIIDTLPENTIYENNTVKLYKVIYNFDGTIKSKELVKNPNISIDGNKITAILPSPTSDAYIMEFQSKTLPLGFAPKPGTPLASVENKAVLSSDGNKDINVTSTRSTIAESRISKIAEGYNGKTKEAAWRIIYNLFKENIKACEAFIVDEAPDQGYIKGSINIETEGGKKLIYGVDYKIEEINKDTFKIVFLKDIKDLLIIDYKTKVSENHKGDIINSANGLGKKVSATNYIKTSGITKEVVKDSINYSSNTVEYVTVLNGVQNADLNSFNVNDEVQNGSLVKDSIVLKDRSTGKILKEGVDYTITFNKKGNCINGFTIKSLKGTNDIIEIRYKENFTNGVKQDNVVKYDYVTNNGESSDKASATFTPVKNPKIKFNKKGFLNSDTKLITWTINVNSNNIKIGGNAVVTDKIPDDQTFVDGSIKVSHSAKANFENNSVKVYLKEGSKKEYIITFQTKLKDNYLVGNEIKNEATYNDSNLSNIKATGVVSKTGQDGVASKTGVEDGNNIDWKVIINPNNFKLWNVRVIDNGWRNIKNASDFKIVNTMNGKTLVEGVDYNLTVAQNAFNIDFLKPVLNSYILTYKMEKDPYGMPNSEVNAENRLIITGDNVSRNIGNLVSRVVYKVSEAGGNIESTNYILKVTKKDSSTLKTISGAIFNLYNASNDKLVSIGMTDKDGVVNFDNLSENGDYRLVEVKPAKGYEISDELRKGILVHINKSDNTKAKEVIQSIDVTNKVSKGSISLTKVDSKDNKKVLEGATFNLLNEKGEVVAKDLVTDKNGQIVVNNLVPGKYAFVETKAPNGYELNSKKYEVTLAADKVGKVQAQSVQVTDKLSVGSISLTKVDSKDNKKVLEGAIFSLLNEKGEVVAKDLVTDKNGQIVVNNLIAGKYAFVETKAPNGYELNSKKYEVTLTADKVGKVQAQSVQVTDKLSEGSITLTKVDSKDNKKVLEGAIFNLLNEKGEVVSKGLVTDKNGQIVVNNLVPGKYAFVETKAPNGYELNSKKYEVTLTADKVGKVQAQSVQAINKLSEGSITLTKVDSKDNKKVLEGAIFNLLNEKGEVVAKDLVTDKNGQIVVNNLIAGKYAFVETKAPIGYELDAAKHEATLTADKNGVVNNEVLVITNKIKENKIVVPEKTTNEDSISKYLNDKDKTNNSLIKDKTIVKKDLWDKESYKSEKNEIKASTDNNLDKLPQTGGFDYNILLYIGIVIIFIAIGITVLKKKR